MANPSTVQISNLYSDPIDRLRINQTFINIPKQGMKGTKGHLNVVGTSVDARNRNGTNVATSGIANINQRAIVHPSGNSKVSLFLTPNMQHPMKYSTTINGTRYFL